jgi:hypothetical protein
MQMRIAKEEHYEYTGCQHSMPFIPNGPMQFFFWCLQYTSDITVVPSCMNSTISTPFLSHQLSGKQCFFKIVQLVW